MAKAADCLHPERWDCTLTPTDTGGGDSTCKPGSLLLPWGQPRPPLPGLDRDAGAAVSRCPFRHPRSQAVSAVSAMVRAPACLPSDPRPPPPCTTWGGAALARALLLGDREREELFPPLPSRAPASPRLQLLPEGPRVAGGPGRSTRCLLVRSQPSHHHLRSVPRLACLPLASQGGLDFHWTLTGTPAESWPPPANTGRISIRRGADTGAGRLASGARDIGRRAGRPPWISRQPAGHPDLGRAAWRTPAEPSPLLSKHGPGHCSGSVCHTALWWGFGN